MDVCDPLSSPGGCAGGDFPPGAWYDQWNIGTAVADYLNEAVVCSISSACNNQDLIKTCPRRHARPFPLDIVLKRWRRRSLLRISVPGLK
jgi:hypothetical protein